jgi:hypothetical protein
LDFAWDKEHAETAATWPTRPRRHGKPVSAHTAGDEGFGSVEHVIAVGILDGRCLQTGHVGAAAWFGDRKRAYLLAAEHLGENLLAHPLGTLVIHHGH